MDQVLHIRKTKYLKKLMFHLFKQKINNAVDSLYFTRLGEN